MKNTKKPKKELTPEEKQKLQKRIKSTGIRVGITSLVLCFLLLICYFFIGWFYRVDSNDMFPSIQDGDLIVYEKFSDVYAKDIVVYEFSGKLFVGRIFGIAGDKIDIRSDGYLTLNDSLPYEVNVFYPTLPGDAQLNYPLTVKDGYAFILGDYRTGAKDSRSFDQIPLSSIKGKVFLLLLRQRALFN